MSTGGQSGWKGQYLKDRLPEVTYPELDNPVRRVVEVLGYLMSSTSLTTWLGLGQG